MTVSKQARKRGPVLVTGGAGYIGGQTTLSLLDCGYEVCVLDDLSTGRRLPFHDRTHFFEGKVHDQRLVREIVTSHNVQAVLHFAGSIKVDESVSNPLKYYENNTEGSRLLIDASAQSGVRHFIFSSTAAVYGETANRPVTESDLPQPLNPYGWSKLFTERLLQDFAPTSDMTFGIFRYFNVAGADPELRHGQYLENPVHLIGRAIDALLGRAPALTIFGDTLPTPDGTGVRDYIHVCDVAEAHVAMLCYLLDGGESQLLNLGYGKGFSVKQVVQKIEEVTGQALPYRLGAVREGEAPSVIADVVRLNRSLDWIPKYASLDEIIQSALQWQESLEV